MFGSGVNAYQRIGTLLSATEGAPSTLQIRRCTWFPVCTAPLIITSPAGRFVALPSRTMTTHHVGVAQRRTRHNRPSWSIGTAIVAASTQATLDRTRGYGTKTTLPIVARFSIAAWAAAASASGK
jgi:hypothetical protein